LALHYTSQIHSAYYSIFFLIREVYFGWCLRYFHSSGASFVFLFLFVHLARAIFYGSYFYNPNTWFSGILLLLFLMAIAFIGYVLPFGQMSFWGATVITNLLSPFPSLVEWICGGYCVHSPTLKRFFVFHFILPFLLCGFVVIHLFYLHYHGSNNPLRLNTNNKISFFPFIFQKDFFGLMLVLCLYFLLFIFSEGLLFVSFFWASFHSSSSPSIGICPGEGFYVPDPCELTFANTLLLSNAAVSLGGAFVSVEINNSMLAFFSFISFLLAWSFISLQIKEFRVMGFSINDSVYSSVFFFLTGLHFFHLLVGLLLLGLFFWGSSLAHRKAQLLHYRITEIHLFYNFQS